MTMISVPVAPTIVALMALLLGLSIPYVSDDQWGWAIGSIIAAVVTYFFVYGLLTVFL